MQLKITVILLLIAHSILGQTKEHQEKFRSLEPDVWLGIWDQENSDRSIAIDTIYYDDIPKYLDFRGSVVEALQWQDNEGEHILIQTVTGHFLWKDYEEGATTYMLQDKAEIYAYLFTKPKGEKKYHKTWRIYDYNECFGVDWFAGFVPKATTITDLDHDGITEVSIPYVLICRGGMDPGTMKIIMYEGKNKYALRGSTMICKGDTPYGGEYKPSPALKDLKLFKTFLEQHWHRHRCENDRFY
ncbi:MAG: hypothetical protein N4A35_08635 [Flavobacteriales bacterium]|jgi:hypothetical protein|nr:hypothetical protein [Flavobacteriales bacterium]